MVTKLDLSTTVQCTDSKVHIFRWQLGEKNDLSGVFTISYTV